MQTILKLTETEKYEQQAITEFRRWYAENRPTLSEAASHATIVAQLIIKKPLLPTRALVLLMEHREWINAPSSTDKKTIGEIVEAHLTTHLIEMLERRGIVR